VLLVFGTLVSFAQQSVSGKVTGADDGSGIPGVNIVEKGTTNGTVSDSDGNYRISVGANATLIFSFVGYASQEVSVGSQSSLNVTMQSDVTALSEVVVTGYGSQEKKEITGSVVSLATKDFNKGNINDPTQLLQGKVAGLSIYNKGGDPNSSSTIRLRGISTVGANASPLVVIDGVLGASLDNVDPNDIETINVLKDGSAAAIYGSRGSSGVILVTTKKGAKKGGIGVTYNGYVSAASVYKTLDVMSPEEYVAAGGNDLGAKTDWQKLVTQTGVSNVHNIAVSGGNDNTQFRLSTNFRNINGVLKESGFDQINGRAGLTHSALDNRLKIDLNMSLTTRKYNKSFNEALRYAALYNPTAPVRFPNGNYYQAILFDNFNPVAIIEQNVNEGIRKNINYGAKIDYSILKNLTLTMNYGQQFTSDFSGEYYSSQSLFRGLNRHGLARRNSYDSEFTLFEAYGTYSTAFDKLNLDVTGGYSYQQDQDQNLFVELGNFPSDELGYNAIENSGDRISGLAARTNISSDKSPVNKIIAGFARVNLTYENAIFLNASIRREGSSKLGENNRWGYFPSVGLGVDLNHYLDLPSTSLLKLRLGYGITGSLPPTYGYAQDLYSYSFNAGGSVTKTRDANPDLKWEQKAELNGGVDFGLFNGKLTGSLDAYTRNINDFIQLQNVPAGQGAAGQQYRNSGKLKTSGLEINLNYNSVRFGGVSWTPGLVVSHYKTTLEEYVTDEKVIAELGAPGQNGTYMVRVAVGEPVGQIWGPVFNGVTVDNPSTADKNEAGSPIFADLNGDGVVDGNPANALVSPDFKKLGNGLPTAEFGWTNYLTFGNWDMNVFFRSAVGHSLVNNFRAFYEPIDPGAINSYNRVLTDKAVSGLTSAQYSSLYVEKAAFVKLDNISLGYNFKLKGGVKNLRAYVTGQNLFQITGYTGIDPEPILQDPGPSDNGGYATVGDVLAPGIDRRNNYFTARTFTFGLNIGL
jgi:TonB-linked SusC/RagA family outer membrane protein